MPSIYEKRIEPSYVELRDDAWTIKRGGIVARRGLYRDGRVGAEYAAQVIARPNDDACLFCEPRLSEEQNVTYQGKRFTAFEASHAYEFFGDHPTGSGGHELVVPTVHTDTPSKIDVKTAREIAEYLEERQRVYAAVPFVRERGNPSKSVEHVHWHSIAAKLGWAIARHAYTWEEGVTELVSERATDVAIDTAGEVVAETEHFAIIRPDTPFAHFDGQEVLKHWRIRLPDSRDAVAMSALRDHFAGLEATTPADQRFQTYTPPALAGQPSSHIEVMRLGLNPVYKLGFNRQDGITELVFAKLPPETVVAINAMRQQR